MHVPYLWVLMWIVMCLHNDSCSGNQGVFSVTLFSSLGALQRQKQEEIIEGAGGMPTNVENLSRFPWGDGFSSGWVSGKVALSEDERTGCLGLVTALPCEESQPHHSSALVLDSLASSVQLMQCQSHL